MTDPSKLADALSQLQGELKPIKRNLKGQAGNRPHNYAGLDAVADAVYPLLGKYGLSFSAKPTLNAAGDFVLAYSLRHVSGERDDGEWPLNASASAQQRGSEITYARRYCLQAVTGATSVGEDDDGHAASQAPGGRQQKRTPAAKTAYDDRQHADLVRAVGSRERPAARTKGPVPDADNLWQDPPGLLPEEQAGSVTKTQLGSLHKLFTDLDVTGRDERLQVTERITGRELTGPHDGRTSSNLAYTEAAAVKRRLGGFTDHSELIAFMAGEVVTT